MRKNPAPMRFKTADHDDIAKYIADDRYVFEPKLDGMRAVIAVEDTVWAMASHGGEMKTTTAGPTARAIVADLEKAYDRLVQMYGVVYIDGEIIGDVMHVFDLVVGGLPDQTYRERREGLEADFMELAAFSPRLRLAPNAIDAQAKKEMFDILFETGGEGVMVKHRDGTYDWGQRVRHSVKIKFVSDADVVVMGFGVGTSAKVKTGGEVTAKDNVVLGVHRDGKLVEVAKASTIGKPEMKVGDVVVVQYLYLGAGDRLTQPTVLRVRDDKAAKDCDWDQLRAVNKSAVDNL